MEERQNRILSIYDAFAAAAAPYKRDAACHKGCAFCCSDAGSIAITTLEGLVIRDRIARLPRPRRVALMKALDADRRRRERGQPSPCPLLQKNRTCLLYTARPFACRRRRQGCGGLPENPSRPEFQRAAMTT